MIRFSTKPMTLKDQVLAQRVGNSDMGALLELIVRRSEPPVTEEVAGDLTSGELSDTVNRLVESIKAATQVDALVTEALRDL